MKRSKHRLNHHRLASFDMGQLVPVGCVEVLPGDTFRHSSSVLLRSGTLVNPLMHPVTARVHHWYVPSRITYEAWMGASSTWENWINGTGSPQSLKQLAVTNITPGSLLNHLGLPGINGLNMNVNGLPLVAYNMIWNEFYRDQDLQTPVNVISNTTLQRIAWEKDYFASCRTNPQFGATTTSIPFSGLSTAPIVKLADVTQQKVRRVDNEAVVSSASALEVDVGGNMQTTTGAIDVYADVSTSHQVNLGGATGGIDVNDFRRALALQRFLENRNRYGSRYRDYLRYLGIKPRDGRIDAAEYLGGGKQTVAFSEVLATAEGTTTEVGDMAGHGIAALRTRPYTRFFEEHGYVLSLMSVRPKAMYQESIPRHWMRSQKDDIWHPEYEQFGPQTVLKKEVYGAHANETDVFGYQERFREYREQMSYVSGTFSSTDEDWHLAREFGSSPSLNSSFVACTPTDRVYADANAPELRAMVNHNLVARRLVSGQARLT